MSTRISPLAHVSPGAELGTNVEIGPFCSIGSHASIGDGCQLQSHVVISGHVTIGSGNRILPHVVIGGEPQDLSFQESITSVEIGDNNVLREGVTINRGAEKEDGITRVGNGNMLMANSHVAHNCHIHNNVILVNGVLLGGHVHVHDNAIISGNSVVHHFSTIGTLAFVSGGCRVPHDIPPYMLAAGSDNPTIKTINIVGLRRKGISEDTIKMIKQAFRLIYRDHKSMDAARNALAAELEEVWPYELSVLLNFIEAQREGKLGRAREAVRHNTAETSEAPDVQRRAA